MKKTLYLCLAALCLAGCKPKAGLYEQAEPGLLAAITNDVVGFRRNISQSVSFNGGAIGDWQATAEIEYVNRLGGVQRATLNYRFILFTNLDGSTSPLAVRQAPFAP